MKKAGCIGNAEQIGSLLEGSIPEVA